MTSEQKTVIFPQHERKHKPTVEEKIRNILNASSSAEAGLEYVISEFPNLSIGELSPIIDNIVAGWEEDRRTWEHERAAMVGIISVMKEANKITGHENLTLEESLRILAERGNKRATASLQHLTRPEAKFWEFVTDRAIESDPYWVKRGRYFKTLEGAIHDTPEALAIAYAKTHMDEILEHLPDDLKEWLFKKSIEPMIQQELDRLVEEGKFEIVGTEDGENIYRKKEST